jgi:beta-phosphoglucomutase-like phosphatase (HAD superfamily)
MIEAVIFDVDGTLVDSVDFHARAWQKAFDEIGRTIDFAAIRSQIGKGGDQLLPVFFSEKEIENSGKDLEERRGEIFKKEYLPRVKSFPKVRELFQKILGDGKKIALASSAKEDELEKYKEIANISDLIQAETSTDDVELSKPCPDIFEAALQKIGDISVDKVIVVGDTPYDAQAAAKIDLRTIGLLCGGFPESRLRGEKGCIAIYKNPADLLEHYEDSPISYDRF